MNKLVVTIPDKNAFYSLYSDGLLVRKTYVRESKSTFIEYDRDAIVVLYYTYPTHREACLVRNTFFQGAGTFLPGLSREVSLIFSVEASRVDKLKRAIAFLSENFDNAFSRNDAFYIRLLFLLRARGKLNYLALRELAAANF